MNDLGCSKRPVNDCHEGNRVDSEETGQEDHIHRQVAGADQLIIGENAHRVTY